LLQLPLAPAGASHHQHAAHDCDEEHPGHGAAGHTAAEHLVQCPGCLFSSAPPPQDFAPAAGPTAAPGSPQSVRPAPPRGEVLAQPPARGPPGLS
jgi:hypothetical protein